MEKFENRMDYRHFKPNEERVRRDSNQTRVSNMRIDEDNTIVNPNQFKLEIIKEENSNNVKRSSKIVRESSNKSKSYADARKSHHVDNSTAIDTKRSKFGKQKTEVRAQDHIAEKKSKPARLNSEELRKIYINLLEDEKEHTYLILDSKTSLGFRENVASEIISTSLLNSVSTSSISDYSFPEHGDTPAESFDNYNHEMLCLLQSLPIYNSTLEQTDISVEIL